MTTILAKNATAGLRIAKHGYTWTINKVSYDPHGNTGDQPRYILVCDSDDAPVDYRKDSALGYLPEAELEVL